jgi:non-canonical purine NTP pyrophosphatase (RdgB/HAM1 family)
MTLYFITKNTDKFNEFKFFIPDIQRLEVDFPEVQEIDSQVIIKEKLNEALKQKSDSFIVEDTFLHLDCLNGLPGPLIKGFLKTLGNRGIYQLVERLGNKNAEARTIIGYARNKKEIYFFENSIKGEIVSPEKESDSEWYSIFKPAGQEKTISEMTEEEKNNLGMRNKSILSLKEHLESEKDLDYLLILKSIKEIPFYLGKNSLIDFLLGNKKNKSIKNNNLDKLKNFRSLSYKKEEEVKNLIEKLISNNFIEITSSNKNRFLRILKLTPKGENEIITPSFYKSKIKNSFTETEITEEDERNFKELEDYLKTYNNPQKKAIISDNPSILCIAGAGSGKTTVLTKRIEFLIKYRSVNPKDILAITFTRKAKQEMEERLYRLGINTNLETFNSFCERILKRFESQVYTKRVRVMNYGDKVMALMNSLNANNLTIEKAIDIYFSENQKKTRTKEQLMNLFMNDCFFILDYFKLKNKNLYDFSSEADSKNYLAAKIIYNLCKNIKDYMDIYGLRDYTDQMLDTFRFFRENKNMIPKFKHILVDEYQDVNSPQVNLIDTLKPENLFVVGDPRQSIFGWRGSDINYILNFGKNNTQTEIITLSKNYRSSKKIVELINQLVKDMNFPDICSSLDLPAEISLNSFESEEQELEFVIEKILSLENPRNEIFVLARTNKQLNEMSEKLRQRQILHIIKTEDTNGLYAKEGEVTLATIHSIKGLEAEAVFVIGCNESNFPCKTSDHPIVEIVKIEEYDREHEEKRLLYVALSRAKNKLFLSYSGKLTRFINKDILGLFNN